jgi:uncharacterized membrane protein YeiH
MAPVSSLVLRALDLCGVAVFAMSGSLAAGRKRLDLFGVAAVAIVTAIGGGTTRDILLGRTPVFWVKDPAQVLVILGATLFTIVYTRFRIPPVRFLLIADAVGLALFTISGAEIAETIGASFMVVMLMGAITGAAGGVLRDVLCNEIPLVLRGGRLYASAALAGAGLYHALQVLGAPRPVCVAIGIASVLALRLASILFGIRLPVYALRAEE